MGDDADGDEVDRDTAHGVKGNCAEAGSVKGAGGTAHVAANGNRAEIRMEVPRALMRGASSRPYSWSGLTGAKEKAPVGSSTSWLCFFLSRVRRIFTYLFSSFLRDSAKSTTEVWCAEYFDSM